jgi:hypothetical protein
MQESLIAMKANIYRGKQPNLRLFRQNGESQVASKRYMKMANLRKRSWCQICKGYDVCGGGIDSDGMQEQVIAIYNWFMGLLVIFYNE